METSGEYRIPASRQAVWDCLNDPAVLKSCLSGCERPDRLSDTAFEAVVTARVGPIKTTFTGPIARRMADDFFGKFADTVGSAQEAEPVVAARAPVPGNITPNSLFRYLLLASAAAFIALAVALFGTGD